MRLICSFVLKDIKEIRHSRKILFSTLVAMSYLTILNIIEHNPLIPMEAAIIPAAIVTTCFGGELLYYLTINEIKYRIFDIFLISQIGRLQLLFCKIALPFLYSFLIAIISLVLNNTVAILFPDYGFVLGVINFETIILLLFSSIIANLFHLGAIIAISGFNTHMHSLTAFVSISILISMYIINLLFGIFAFVMVSTAIILLLILFDCNLITLYKQAPSFRKAYRVKSIFPDRKISDIFALLGKEILVSRFNFFKIIYLIILSAFPLSVNSFAINDVELLKVLFRITLYFVCSFAVFNILLPVIKIERINAYTDVFHIAQISKFKFYFSKCILPFSIMLIGLVLSFFLTWIYHDKINNVFLFDYVAVITSVVSTACSIVISFCLSRYIHSYKDVRIIEIFIIAITFVLHIIISFIPYLLS